MQNERDDQCRDFEIGLVGSEAQECPGEEGDRVRTAERRFRDLVGSLDGIVWEADAMTVRFTFVSEQSARILGYAPEEWLADPTFWEDRIHPDERPSVVACCGRATSEGRNHALEYRFRAADGRFVWLHDVVTIVRNERNQVVTLRGVMFDVTQARAAAEAAHRAQEQLRHAQKMEAIGRLAGGVAHDFNNLLTIIIGGVDAAARRLGPDSDAQPLLDQVRQAGERAATLTRQLLTLGRRQPCAPVLLDLNVVVREMEGMLARVLGETVALRTSLSLAPCRVTMDRGHVEQILLNLAVNGRDAMPGGGTLVVETELIDLDEDNCRSHSGVDAGSYVRLAVSDTGIGMTDEVRSRIFEPFFTTKAEGRGTGLGLAIVFGIVEQANGHIWVYSEPGKGTTFKVLLPVANGESTEASEPDEAAAEGGSEVVLLAEDEESVRRLVSHVLRAAGYSVLEAPDGARALEIARAHEGVIHLLLTDVVMPRMGGHELAQAFAQMRPDARILLMSGYTQDSAALARAASGEIALLEKPFTAEALCRRVRLELNQGTPRRERGR